jgi:hypothetical protein
VTLLNSTYLDATGNDLTTATTVKEAFGLTDVGQAGPDARITIALVLDRANDPTNLLNMDWADRQAALAALNANGTLASSFGANPADFSVSGVTATP